MGQPLASSRKEKIKLPLPLTITPKETKEAAGAIDPKEIGRNCEAAVGAFRGEVDGCSNKES